MRIPPLRERREDIPVLAEYFVRKFRQDTTLQFTPAVMEVFQRYDWPGNVRELENTVAKCVYASPGPWIDASALPAQFGAYVRPDLRSAPPEVAPHTPLTAQAATAHETPLSGSIVELERNAIASACQQTGGNLSKAARLLGISRPTLYRKLKQYGIAIPERNRRQTAGRAQLLRH